MIMVDCNVMERFLQVSVSKKCPYLESFWSVFWTEYRQIQSISLDSFHMLEIGAQKNSKYRHFSCSVCISTLDEFAPRKTKHFIGNNMPKQNYKKFFYEKKSYEK